ERSKESTNPRAIPRPHPGGGVVDGRQVSWLPDRPTPGPSHAGDPCLDRLPCSGTSGFVPGYSGGGRAGISPASLFKTREPPLARRPWRHRTVWFVKEAPHDGRPGEKILLLRRGAGAGNAAQRNAGVGAVGVRRGVDAAGP